MLELMKPFTDLCNALIDVQNRGSYCGLVVTQRNGTTNLSDTKGNLFFQTQLQKVLVESNVEIESAIDKVWEAHGSQVI